MSEILLETIKNSEALGETMWDKLGIRINILSRLYSELEQRLESELRQDNQKIYMGPSDKVVDHSNKGLRLIVNLGKGLDGYERVTVIPREEDFNINYFGLYSCAFDTFLKYEYNKEIWGSELLSRLKKKVEGIKRKGKFSSQSYDTLIIKEETTKSDLEVEMALYFFYKVFKEKVEREGV